MHANNDDYEDEVDIWASSVHGSKGHMAPSTKAGCDRSRREGLRMLMQLRAVLAQIREGG